MTVRPLLTAPLPWLNMIAGWIWPARHPRPGVPALSKWPRSLKVTREGWWYIGILLFTGVAAINTGNNLLYLVVATLLSIIIISGILSESTLRAVRIGMEVPGRVYKQRPAPVYLTIDNRKRFIPSFSFTISGQAGGAVLEPVYVLRLGPGESYRRVTHMRFERRGKATVPGLKVVTRFPFGLFVKGKTDHLATEVLVYPNISAGSRKEADITARFAGDMQAPIKGSGAQIRSLREYMFGDDARFIHWMSAGRSRMLLMKEFERETEKKVTIVFDNHTGATEEAFEECVDLAASIAADLLGRGLAVGLKTLSFDIQPGAGPTQLDSILTRLALIEPTGPSGVPGVRVV